MSIPKINFFELEDKIDEKWGAFQLEFLVFDEALISMYFCNSLNLLSIINNERIVFSDMVSIVNISLVICDTLTGSFIRLKFCLYTTTAQLDMEFGMHFTLACVCGKDITQKYSVKYIFDMSKQKNAPKQLIFYPSFNQYTPAFPS